MHSPVVGVVIKTTLLNWEGKIAYDGLLAPAHMATQATLRKALQAYEVAYNANSIITQLPLVEPSPLLGQPLSEQELAILSAAVRDDLQVIFAKPLVSSNVATGSWVFRRFGYSEKENPNHVAFIMSSGL
eukprot:gene45767-56017_t